MASFLLADILPCCHSEIVLLFVICVSIWTCLVNCHLRLDPDMSCKLSYVLLLTNCLVIGVQEDADDISHRPLFPVRFPEAAKDLFLAAEEKRI